MDKQTNQFISMATEIGEIIWSKLHLNTNQEFNYSIYSGLLGISILMLDLYRATGEEKFLERSICLVQKVENQENLKKSEDYSLYFGKAGLALMLSKIGDITGEVKYKTQAASVFLEKAKPTVRSLPDLLNGLSGEILSILHLLYNHSSEQLEKLLLAYVESLISHAKITTEGFYWNNSFKYKGSLNGIAHGNSGIALALFELGHYYQEEDLFYELGLHTITFDNAAYSSVHSNWPDYRLEEPLDEILNRFSVIGGSGIDFSPSYSKSSWCNGAGGILVQRTRAYHLTGRKELLKDIQRAKRVIHDYIQVENLHLNPSICCGYPGLGLSLLHLPESLFLEQSRNLCEQLGERIYGSIQVSKNKI